MQTVSNPYNHPPTVRSEALHPTDTSPGPILVITGFVAVTASGTPTTLKRSGSDFSATIFARLLKVRVCIQEQSMLFFFSLFQPALVRGSPNLVALRNGAGICAYILVFLLHGAYADVT